MKQKELMKKYWFVLVIAICALFFVGYYTIQEAKNQKTKIATAQKDGNYLIYQMGDDTYTADQLYDDLYVNHATTTVFRQVERMTLAALYPATSEMQTLAANNAHYLLSQYGEAAMEKEMLRAGFNGAKGLNDYFIHFQRGNFFARDFFMKHKEDIVTPFIQKNNSKMISHILVKVANVEEIVEKDGNKKYVAHPSEEEQKKLDSVLEALKNTAFAEVAKKYSEDGSAENGGSLGYFDNQLGARYVPEFTNAAKPLQEGQVSEVVVTQFGWHVLRCDASNVESLLKEEAFINQLRSTNTLMINKAIYEKAKELDIHVEDEKIRTEIETVLGVTAEAKK